MHLRPRTNTIGAVARIRNALAFATHKFFQVRCLCLQYGLQYGVVRYRVVQRRTE